MSNAAIRRARLLSVPAALGLLLVACGGGNEPVAESAAGDAPEPAAAGAEHTIVYAAPAGDASEVFSASLAGEAAHQLTSLGGDVAFPV